jgi:hypothetical protein
MKPQPITPDRPVLVVIECIHGQIYAGHTLADALARWRIDSPHIRARTQRQWMEGIARRTLAWCKMHVRTDNVENFCDDLTMAGQIIVRRTN